MDFKNTTTLSSQILEHLFHEAATGWPSAELVVRVRWSRGADFSGTCMYDAARIYVNLGRHLRYPYRMETYCARSRRAAGGSFKPSSFIELCDGYQVCLFVFAHELCHLLIHRAGRNTSQKESMCDRFAARILIDYFDCRLCDARGRAVPRREWDFQDIDAFVAAARATAPAARAIPPQRAARAVIGPVDGDQRLLFDV